MIYVDVIDNGCSLRRRIIAIRAEREMLRLLSQSNWRVREFEIVGDWAARGLSIDGHVVFLHAPRQDNWEQVVEIWADESPKMRRPGLLVSYTGGPDSPPEVGTVSVEDPNCIWWKHFTEVLGTGDYEIQEEAVNVNATRLPIEKVLRKVFANADVELMGAASNGSADSIRDSHLRHVVVNAVSPLRLAILHSLATDSEVSDFAVLWGKLQSRLQSSEYNVPLSILDSLSTLETVVLPALDDPATRRSALETLALDLGRMQRVADSSESYDTDWHQLANFVNDDLGNTRVKLLWIDDEDSWFLALRNLFEKCGFDVHFQADLTSLEQFVESITSYEAIVLDIGLRGSGELISRRLAEVKITPPEAISDENAGLGLLQLFQQAIPFGPPVFMLSAHASPSLVQACTRLGASGYLLKDKTDYIGFLTTLFREVSHYHQGRRDAAQPRNSRLIVGGVDDPLNDVLLKIARITERGIPGPIILVGEPGVGKEELAKEIQLRSRRNGKLHVVDCSAISPTLVESELFGYKKGAFTDAKEDRKGLFEIANGETLFIDEVDKIDPSIQKKLLGALERRTIRRLGDVNERAIDVLVILASNEDPDQGALDGRFSKELVSRITFKIVVPPLNNRVGAVRDLVQGICNRLGEDNDWPPVTVSSDAIKWLEMQVEANKFGGINGNVRGLQRLLVRTLTYYSEEYRIELAHLQRAFDEQRESPPHQNSEEVLRKVGETLAAYLETVGEANLDELEDKIRAELFSSLRSRIDRKEIAEKFGLTRENLRQKLKELRSKGLLSADV